MTTTQFFQQWLDDQQYELQRSTYEAYTVYFNKHIIPYFDYVGDLCNLTARNVKDYVNHLRKNGRIDGKGGLGQASVKKHLSVIKQALNDAVMEGYIYANPALSVKIRRSTKAISPKTVMMTAAEAQEVIDAFLDHPLRPAVILALLYGLRRSEVLGLRWSAIDFNRNELRIEHTVVKSLTIEAKDSTKTDGSAAIYPILPEVRPMLLEMYEKRVAGSEYLFVWPDGRRFRPDYVTRGFQRQLKNKGLRRMRFHDLRHSTASILFDRGMSLEDVKNWLRHDDIETTSNIYLHYGRGRQKIVSDAMNGMFQI